MPTIKLGNDSKAFSAVANALEARAGLPLSNGGDYAWLRELVGLVNKKEGTDIAFVREDYGYHFSYAKPESAQVLGEIKQKGKL